VRGRERSVGKGRGGQRRVGEERGRVGKGRDEEGRRQSRPQAKAWPPELFSWRRRWSRCECGEPKGKKVHANSSLFSYAKCE